MKTESLLSQKSSSTPSSKADAEIFNVYRLPLVQKPYTKTRTLGPKNHPRSPVQLLTLTSSTHIDYCSSETVDENWVTVVTKKSSTPSSKADAEIFNVHRLLLAQKPFTKTRTLGPKNHPRSPLLQLRLTASTHIDYWWLRNCWWKLSPCCHKNHPRHLVLRLMLKSSMYIDYCWFRNRLRKLGPWDPKIIQEAQFYGWRWHLLRT